ncbi:MAG: mycofactocin oligosaccharide methyltransferase MftM [Actinomycetes bacterium]
MSSSSGSAALVETAHFRVLGACVEPRRWPDVDNDLTDVIVDELAPLGLIPDVCAFERLFTSIVEGSAPTPGLAWNSFYRNTLARLRRPADPQGRRSGSVAAFARIYAEVGRLTLGGSVLDVASCFGFLPILLAERLPGVVVGSDADKATALLAGRVAGALGSQARFLVADARRLPLPERAVATVTVVHLLEHLRPSDGARVLAEATRVADRRVIVAVPFEDTPNPAYGHVRTFDPRVLAELGGATGWRYATWVSDGGWLVLDRP